MTEIKGHAAAGGKKTSRRLEDRRWALKQIGALSGLGALNLFCGPELKAAVLQLVQTDRPQRVSSSQAAVTPRSRYRPLAIGGTPKAFTQKDLALLGDLVELIIPTTDTPGAQAAGVHWYIDAVAEVDADLRQAFIEGFRWLRQRSQAHFGQAFRALREQQRLALIAQMGNLSLNDPGRRFFELLKQWTLDGYYKSEIGLLQELEWVGHEYLASFPGCPHPDPSHRRTS